MLPFFVTVTPAKNAVCTPPFQKNRFSPEKIITKARESYAAVREIRTSLNNSLCLSLRLCASAGFLIFPARAQSRKENPNNFGSIVFFEASSKNFVPAFAGHRFYGISRRFNAVASEVIVFCGVISAAQAKI